MCAVSWLRGCELQVHLKIEPQKRRNRGVGVPNLNLGAPSWSPLRGLWSSQLLRALNLSGLMRRSWHLTERLPLWQLGRNIYGKLCIMGKREDPVRKSVARRSRKTRLSDAYEFNGIFCCAQCKQITLLDAFNRLLFCVPFDSLFCIPSIAWES